MKRIDWDFLAVSAAALVILVFAVVLMSSVILGCNGTTYYEPTSGDKVTYSSLSASVFSPSCVVCHGPGPRDLTSYSAVLKYVVPGKPESSPLCKRMVNGSMPPSGKMPEAIVEMVCNWIEDGALEF